MEKRILPYTKFLTINKNLIARLKAQSQVITANRKNISAVYNAVAKLCGKDNVTLDVGVVTNKCLISGMARSLDSFKARKLVTALERCAEAVGAEFASTDYPEYSNRDFRAEGPTIIVTIGAYVKSDSPKCFKRLVRTDRTITERPVYELVCN